MINSGISVVIPTLGQTENLKTLVSSVLNQEKIAKELLDIVIVINGLPQQNYFKIKSDISNLNPEIEFQWAYIEQANVNIARNKGLDLARFDYVCFFDDDCELNNRSTLNFYWSAMDKDSQLFALGGGYCLPSTANYWDELYNSIQMAWLLSGKVDQSHNILHLLGGNFILNKKILKENSIQFEEQIAYGGSEHQLFLAAATLKLKVQLSNIDVKHNTKETFSKICRKIYKQGQGKALLDEKYGQIENSFKNQNLKYISKTAIEINYLNIKLEFYKKILNYIFWFGYYNKQNKSYLIFVKVFSDFLNYLNYLRFKIIDKVK